MTDTHAGETILTVEDEDAMREVTRRILARNGYRTITCSSGDEALERARQHDGDLRLLLTDVVMPGMLGRELADKLRAVRPSIPVLYMSGYDHQTLTTQGIIDPGVVVIPKPFSEPTLIAKIREVLDSPT
jgi:CheY-like chemotaxis protein